MKCYNSALLLLSVCVLSSCANNDPIKPPDNRFTLFSPPQGDPTSLNSWRLKGPGAILRRQNYEVEYDARHILGDERLTKIVTDANTVGERVPYAALSNKRTSGSSFDAEGGWSVDGALAVKGQLNLANATSVDIQFGNSWIAELTEHELREASGTKGISAATRNNLSRTTSHFVLKTVYTDSLKIYFKTTKEGGGEVAVKIPLQDQQKLSGNYKVTNDGGVEISGPIMVGYVPLSREGVTQLFAP